MTELLERAFAAASALPDAEQNAMATLLLSELEAEKQWTEAFATSQDALAALADEALREHAAGATLPLDLADDFTHH